MTADGALVQAVQVLIRETGPIYSTEGVAERIIAAVREDDPLLTRALTALDRMNGTLAVIGNLAEESYVSEVADLRREAGR